MLPSMSAPAPDPTPLDIPCKACGAAPRWTCRDHARLGDRLWCDARALAFAPKPIAVATMMMHVKVDAIEISVDEAVADVLLGFAWAHLPAERAEVSRRFGELAAWAAEHLPHNRELVKALDALLVAKDAAVRASMRPVAKAEPEVAP